VQQEAAEGEQVFMEEDEEEEELPATQDAEAEPDGAVHAGGGGYL
jgi:hypothetical protein